PETTGSFLPGAPTSRRRCDESHAWHTSSSMTKRERVMAALGGREVDRIPLAFWMHNFATENSAGGLTAETLRLARTFNWDYLKPQSRAQCFAVMWGLAYRPSTERATTYTFKRHLDRSA